MDLGPSAPALLPFEGQELTSKSKPRCHDQHSPEDEDNEHERSERVLGTGVDVGVLELELLHE